MLRILARTALALLDSGQGKVVCSDLAKCRPAYLPASTFKIPLRCVG